MRRLGIPGQKTGDLASTSLAIEYCRITNMATSSILGTQKWPSKRPKTRCTKTKKGGALPDLRLCRRRQKEKATVRSSLNQNKNMYSHSGRREAPAGQLPQQQGVRARRRQEPRVLPPPGQAQDHLRRLPRLDRRVRVPRGVRGRRKGRKVLQRVLLQRGLLQEDEGAALPDGSRMSGTTICALAKIS